MARTFRGQFVAADMSCRIRVALRIFLAGAVKAARRGCEPNLTYNVMRYSERYFGGDARSWLNLQAAYDLRVAEIAGAKRVEREIAPATA